MFIQQLDKLSDKHFGQTGLERLYRAFEAFQHSPLFPRIAFKHLCQFQKDAHPCPCCWVVSALFTCCAAHIHLGLSGYLQTLRAQTQGTTRWTPWKDVQVCGFPCKGSIEGIWASGLAKGPSKINIDQGPRWGTKQFSWMIAVDDLFTKNDVFLFYLCFAFFTGRHEAVGGDPQLPQYHCDCSQEGQGVVALLVRRSLLFITVWRESLLWPVPWAKKSRSSSIRSTVSAWFLSV